MSEKNKVAIVTGGGSGIGRQTVLALLKADFAVALAGRREAALRETIEMAGADGPQATAIPTDITKADSVKNLFKKTCEIYGRIDVLFNNSGIGAPGVLFEDLTLQQWQSVVDTNLTGAFLCSQEAFKVMKNQLPRGGRIINNGSISAHVPRPNSAPYTATKHAITGLTRSTALDGRKYDIACGQIDIGNASTNMTSRMSGGVPQAGGETAVEPTMSVNNVAEAVVFMANLPLNANVLFITVMATQMPYVGRG